MIDLREPDAAALRAWMVLPAPADAARQGEPAVSERVPMAALPLPQPHRSRLGVRAAQRLEEPQV